MTARRSRFGRRLFVALLAALMVLGALEVAVRLLGLEARLARTANPILLPGPGSGSASIADYGDPPRRAGRPLRRVDVLTVPDPRLGWRLLPDAISERGGVVVVTSSVGLRTGEVAVPKPPGEVRVLCLGDSLAFGWGLNEPDMWTTLLEERLARRSTGPRYRVVNAAIYGYATRQGRIQLGDEQLRRMEPDVVLMAFGLNDAAPPARGESRYVRRSALFRLLRRLREPSGSAATAAMRARFSANLRAMIGQARGLRAGPVVVGQVVADGAPSWSRELPSFATLARQTARETDAPFVDLAEAFAGVTQVEGQTTRGREPVARYFRDACHPTPAGSGVIADAVAETLARTHLRAALRSGESP